MTGRALVTHQDRSNLSGRNAKQSARTRHSPMCDEPTQAKNSPRVFKRRAIDEFALNSDKARMIHSLDVLIAFLFEGLNMSRSVSANLQINKHGGSRRPVSFIRQLLKANQKTRRM